MTGRERPEPRPVYVLTLLAARNDATTIRGLRAILKLAWRRYRFRCLDLREVHDRASPDEPRRPG
jgi:hypothetical protein